MRRSIEPAEFPQEEPSTAEIQPVTELPSLPEEVQQLEQDIDFNAGFDMPTQFDESFFPEPTTPSEKVFRPSHEPQVEVDRSKWTTRTNLVMKEVERRLQNQVSLPLFFTHCLEVEPK